MLALAPANQAKAGVTNAEFLDGREPTAQPAT
jgi:hypothetical protein